MNNLQLIINNNRYIKFITKNSPAYKICMLYDVIKENDFKSTRFSLYDRFKEIIVDFNLLDFFKNLNVEYLDKFLNRYHIIDNYLLQCLLYDNMNYDIESQFIRKEFEDLAKNVIIINNVSLKDQLFIYKKYHSFEKLKQDFMILVNMKYFSILEFYIFNVNTIWKHIYKEQTESIEFNICKDIQKPGQSEDSKNPVKTEARCEEKKTKTKTKIKNERTKKIMLK